MRKLDGPLTHKVCPRCGIDKSASEFHKARTAASGLAGHCKECSKALTYAWRAANPEKTQAIDQRWQERHGRERQFIRRYGLTMAQYQAWFRGQQGVCALCQQPETTRAANGTVRLLGVDHDHKTGQVRGLLCHLCNSMVEQVVRHPQVLNNLRTYLALPLQ